jgi:hypothetical protein
VLVLAQNSPVIVTLLDKPTDQTTFADVILGAFGITGILVLIALVLGVVMAFAMVTWNKRHRPEEDHLPSITT